LRETWENVGPHSAEPSIADKDERVERAVWVQVLWRALAEADYRWADWEDAIR
jgi:hypothetical protein